MNVVIVDSRQSTYVETPDIERNALGEGVNVSIHHVSQDTELDESIETADIIISWHTVALTENAIARMKYCKGIVRAAVGYDNIDIDFAANLGIPVSIVPDYGTEEVADHALGLILALVRNFATTDRCARDGDWDWRRIGKVRRLRGMPLGLVGFGRIGMAAALRAKAFGLRVAFYDPYVPSGVDKSLGVRRVATLDQLMSESAIVSIHVPKTAATRGMVGRRELSLMPPDGVLVNTARGDVVDQGALIAHLAANPAFRAGLDVLAAEPDVPDALRESAQVILTSHSAFYADDSLPELRRKAAQTALRLYRGEIERAVVNTPRRAAAE